MLRKGAGDFQPNDSSISNMSSLSLDDVSDNKEVLQNKINQEIDGLMSDLSSDDDSDFISGDETDLSSLTASEDN